MEDEVAPRDMSPQERRAALEREFAPWRPRTLDGQFEHAVARFPDRPYLVAPGRVHSYAGVLAWAQRYADGLAALGVRPGDHVALLLANYPEYAPLKLAIARVGAVAVPLNYLYRVRELGYVLEQSRSRMLITMTSFGALDHLAMLDELAPGWEREGAIGLGELKRVITFSPENAEHREGALTVQELEQFGAAHPGGAPGGRRAPEDPSDIMYTSGTTGLPKGALLTHDGLQRTAYGSAFCRALPDGNRVVFSLPCYHMFGYEQALQASVFVGGAIVPQPQFDPLAQFRAIERHRVTDILAVPTMTLRLIEHPERERHDLSSLRSMLSAAAAAPHWLWRAIGEQLGVRELTTAYGMTELSGATTMTRPEDPLEIHATTVGRPKPSGAAGLPARDGALIEYRILDPLTGEPVFGEESGELVSRGPTTMLGYWDRPEETATVLRGGWLYSGDLGRLLPDGSMVITGRSKDLYKSGGELVMPKEIEDLLTTQPGVSDAHVVGVPDDHWGEVGCAFVVGEPDHPLDPEALLEACRAGLARFKVPRLVIVLRAEELPLTPTGKVQKFRLVPIAQERITALTRASAA